MFYLYSKTLEHVFIKLLEIISLAYVLITQSAHREYSSVNNINDIYSSVDLKQGFDTRWGNVLFTMYVLKHWNVLKLLEIISLVALFTRLKLSLCARFGAVIYC